MVSRSFRLGLERLDDRNAPSSLFGNAVASTDWMPQPDTDSPIDLQPYGNAKPKIVGFKVVIGPGGWATFSGKVVDEAAAGMPVILNGPQSCFDPSPVALITDANGNFSFVAQLGAGDSGIATADTTDAQGLAADTAEYNVTL